MRHGVGQGAAGSRFHWTGRKRLRRTTRSGNGKNNVSILRVCLLYKKQWENVTFQKTIASTIGIG